MFGLSADSLKDFLTGPTSIVVLGLIVLTLILSRVPKARLAWSTCFSTTAQPSPLMRTTLNNLLFVLLGAWYFWASYQAHLENADEKLIPTLSMIWRAVIQVTTQPDRLGNIWLRIDLPATAERFGLSLLIVSSGIIIGLLMGVFPYVEAFLQRFHIAMDKFVALSVLPLVMAMLGIGLPFHVGLVVFGVWPTVVLTAYGEAKGYPTQLKIKSRTLGASSWEQAFRVVLPGIWPKMLDVALRLNFKAIAGLVVAAEMIVGNDGLGFRIAMVRRFNGMDVVIVYALLLTLLLFILDVSVTAFIRWRYPYYNR